MGWSFFLKSKAVIRCGFRQASKRKGSANIELSRTHDVKHDSDGRAGLGAAKTMFCKGAR